MKKKSFVIDSVDSRRRRCMLNAISQRSIPVICLDDDDDHDNDDLMIDKDYKLFLDRLRDDSNLSSHLEVDNGESNTRIFSGYSKRTKLGNENPVNNIRVFQQRKRNNVEVSRVKIRDNIQRDNRVAERRKRRIAELDAPRTSRPVPFVKTDQDCQRDNNVRNITEVRAEIIRDVPLVRTEEDIRRDYTVSQGRKRKADELNAESLRKAVPLVRTEEDIQRHNAVSQGRKRKAEELKAEILRKAVPLVRTEEDIQRDNTVSLGRKRKPDELKAETLRKAVPLVRTEDDIQRDNRVAERKQGNIAETKTAETSRVVHVERVNRVTEVKDVDETSRSKDVSVGTRKKNGEQCAAVVDKDYLTYLTWLVDSIKDSTTKPMANLQKDQSDFDPPISDTLKESTTVPDKDVKIEQDLESSSDDSDIIMVSDSPFSDEVGAPFVASKKRVDLDEGSKEDESGRSWFRKELMDVLSKPFDEGDLEKLHHEASIHRKMTRCRELRKGRESDYETEELGKSYREMFTDFDKEYKPVDGVDKFKSLKLLRGFFFYLQNVSHDGAFKPWEKNQWCQP